MLFSLELRKHGLLIAAKVMLSGITDSVFVDSQPSVTLLLLLR